MAYTKYSLTPANNTAAPPDGAPEGMLPSAVNDTMRDMMAQIRDCGDGIRDGTYTMTAPKITGGTITGATVTSNTFSSSGATITGGTINSTAIGGTTAAAGKFTTLEATGVTTVQAGTVSLPAITTSGDTNTGIFFPAADTIAFTEGGAEAMRIDSSGRVGIGTTSPSAKLNVIGGNIRLDNNQGLEWAGSNNYIYGNETTDFIVIATNGNEAMRIDSSGNLLVGKTTTNDTTQGTKLNINYVSSAGTSDFYLAYSTTAAAYRFYVTQAGTVFATNTTISAISDQRLKENIQDIDVGLDKIMALKPRKFDWKEGKGKNIKGDRGWIAQEFEQVFPEMINEWKDPAPEGEEPYKSVAADLIPVLVKAIQEQQQIINDLKARIETLESK